MSFVVSQKQKEESWIKHTAREMDIEVDDYLATELGIGSEAKSRVSTKGKLKSESGESQVYSGASSYLNSECSHQAGDNDRKQYTPKEKQKSGENPKYKPKKIAAAKAAGNGSSSEANSKSIKAIEYAKKKLQVMLDSDIFSLSVDQTMPSFTTTAATATATSTAASASFSAPPLQSHAHRLPSTPSNYKKKYKKGKNKSGTSINMIGGLKRRSGPLVVVAK